MFLRDLVCDRIRDGIQRVDSESQNEGFNGSYPYRGGPFKNWNAINENRHTPAPEEKTHIARCYIQVSNSWMSRYPQGCVHSEDRVGTTEGLHRAGCFGHQSTYVHFDFGVDNF